MIELEFAKLYLKFRYLHYQNLFASVTADESSPTPADATAAEVIYLLGEPTVKEFADFTQISQSNATYKLNSLIKRGYITKLPSADKRETRLSVTPKFLDYYGANSNFILNMMENIHSKFTDDEIDIMERFIKRLREETL